MIETERLILRRHVEADFEALHAIWSDADVVRYISGRPSTPDQSWSRLLRAAGSWSMLGFGPFAVIIKQSGQFIGDVGHADYHRGLGEAFDPFPEAGWVLARQVHGKGYATEAVLAAHTWFDENRPETRSVCIISPDNTASLRVADKAGYQPFGRSEFGGSEVVMLMRDRPGG